jgi:hypothetical protein
MGAAAESFNLGRIEQLFSNQRFTSTENLAALNASMTGG